MDLVPVKEFDDWAASYDEDVAGGQEFPFDGYAHTLQLVVKRAATTSGDVVLDLGIGTGNLARLFARQGCQIWGLDFSAQMLVKARGKLPEATLGQADLREAWPGPFQRRFDAIVSAYTFHHFTLPEKAALVRRLLDNSLCPGGRLVIGDIAFRNGADEDRMRLALGAAWEAEYYWLAVETITTFEALGIQTTFTQVSSCAGVFEFSRG